MAKSFRFEGEKERHRRHLTKDEEIELGHRRPPKDWYMEQEDEEDEEDLKEE